MADLVSWSSLAMASILSLPMLVFSVEASLGILRTQQRLLFGDIPKTCIMITAHNEAAVIRSTLERLLPALPGNVRVMVVADNCSDDTAEIARSLMVDVFERADQEKRGKGYALAFGRDRLATHPPECVIVLDADCSTDTQSIADLARWCAMRDSAVQARNILKPDLSASTKVQISTFAFWVKNVVRQRGAYRIGGGGILAGTGMAFPWEMFARLPLATGDIVEDLALSVNLTQSGQAPLFFEQSTVSSPAAPEHATLQQRSRWEHGFLGVALTHGLSALWRGISRRNLKSLLLGFHLMVPPLTMLLAMSIMSILIFIIIGLVCAYWLPMLIIVSMLALMLMVIIVNWILEGRQWLSLTALLSAPGYVIWKLPVYGKFLLGKTSTWVRTDRG